MDLNEQQLPFRPIRPTLQRTILYSLPHSVAELQAGFRQSMRADSDVSDFVFTVYLCHNVGKVAIYLKFKSSPLL